MKSSKQTLRKAQDQNKAPGAVRWQRELPRVFVISVSAPKGRNVNKYMPYGPKTTPNYKSTSLKLKSWAESITHKIYAPLGRRSRLVHFTNFNISASTFPQLNYWHPLWDRNSEKLKASAAWLIKHRNSWLLSNWGQLNLEVSHKSLSALRRVRIARIRRRIKSRRQRKLLIMDGN